MTIEEYTQRLLPIRDKLFRLASRFLTDTDDARDMVQDTYLKLWSSKTNLDDVRNMEAMAMAVTRNLCLDKLKSHATKYRSPEPAEYENADHQTPDRHTEHAEMRRWIHRLVNSLPEQQRTVMHLRDVEGLEMEQIAFITGQTPNAARVNLSRARKRVKEELEKIYAYETTA